MKFLLSSLFFIFSMNSFGQVSSPTDPVPPTPLPGMVKVELRMNLNIVKMCSGDLPICTSSTSFPSNSTIKLYRDYSRGAHNSLYKGEHSVIRSIDDVRAVGIVTIKRTELFSTMNETQYNFHIGVEILTERGIIAKMSTNVTDMASLSSMRLIGSSIEGIDGKYIPSLAIGSAIRDTIPMPTPVKSNEDIIWDVEIGSIE